MERRKVYDKVWVMRNNSAEELSVFAVVESMNYNKNGIDVFYHLTPGTWGVGWGNNEGVRYSEDIVFDTKGELIAYMMV